MKKTMWTLLALLLLCLALPAMGEEIGYTIDVADEITVGLGETIHLPFERPYSHLYKFNAYCSDPDALKEWKEVKPETTYTDTTLPVTGTFDVSFQKKGTFDLHITFEGREIRTISVTVDDLSTAASLSRERFVLRAGETVNTGLTLENGAMYNLPTFTKDAYYDSFVQISEDGLTLKGLSKGHMTIHVVNPLKQELCQFEVVVVEESENVELSCPQEYAAVGKNLTLSAKSNGEEAFPLVTITEGSDCVRWDGDSRVWSFYPFAPGWVTFTAYGTDGSTSSVRIRVLSGSDDIVYDIPKTTLAAGETVDVSVVFPSNTWCTINSDQPAERGLEGTVALVNNNRLTAVTAGTCSLVIHGVNVNKVIPITVTDSPQALTVIRPNPYMDMESSFQLSVQDKLGNVYPAQYSASGYVSVDENGLLTPTEFSGNATVQVELENGAEFSFDMWTKRFPKELTCTAEEIVLPLNDQFQGVNSNGTIGDIIFDELGAVSSNDLIVCSDDPSIVLTEVEGNSLYPQRIGNTTLTVWSKYCDLSVRVPIRVTDPMDLLYVDGRDSYADLKVAKGTTVSLPTVTDYYGNPVQVTWKIQSSSTLHDQPNVKAFSLVNNGTKIKCHEDSYNSSFSAKVIATSQKGATLTLDVRAYSPYEMFELVPAQEQITTGSDVQVHVNGKKDNGDSTSRTLYKDDFTYTLTGDTDCLTIESYMPYYCVLHGLKPGTVTFTVTMSNGMTHSSVIQVVLPDVCQNGHDPVWKTEEENTALSKGTEALRCGRCNVDLGERRETPATGVISFAEQNFYFQPGQEIDLMTQLDGNRHYSFTWESSDPSVARVVGDKLTVYDFGETTITAYAYDCTPGTCQVHVIDQNADMIAYGDWVNLHWTLDQEGLLTISGTGAMDDFELHNQRAAWHLYSSDIKRVVIEEGVTSIGANAFEFCDKFTEISIPDTVTVIGDNALNACSLTEIHVPASVTAIGERAFMDNWYLEAIHVDEDNPVYRSLDGVLFSRDQSLLIQYPSAKAGSVYAIPAGVTVIGDDAFRHSSNLTEITIPSGVTKIGRDAFCVCVNLSAVVIPEGVTEIGSSAFAMCSSLTSAYIPEGVSTLEQSLFDDCGNLASVRIPASVTRISIYAFSMCDGLKDVYYNSTEEDWAGIEIEYANDELLRATIHYASDIVPDLILPENLTGIETQAFSGLPSGTVVFIPYAVSSIADDAFDRCTVIVTPAGSYAAQWGREHGMIVLEEQDE